MSIFSKVRERKPQRSRKDLSHNTLFDTGFGRIVPTCVKELTANDYCAIATSNFVQPVALYAPAFTKIRVRSRTFAVPHRILMGREYLEDFLVDSTGEMYEPYTTLEDLAQVKWVDHWNTDSSNPQYVYALQHGQLADYFNIATLPIASASSTAVTAANVYSRIKGTDLGSKKISLMKALAYFRIWNDWYRNENYEHDYEDIFTAIQNLPNFPYVSIADLWSPDWSSNNYRILDVIFQIQFANVGKDYFTGALPFQQAGSPVRIPVGDIAPVLAKDISGNSPTLGYKTLYGVIQDTNDLLIGPGSDPDYSNKFGMAALNVTPSSSNPPRGLDLFADLSSTAGIEVVEFRTFLAAQRWAERNGRGGRRLPEVLSSRFGSKINDAFLDRSIYIGGSAEDVKIDTIFATTANGEAQQLGDYAGRGYAAGKSKYLGYHTIEPCILMTVQTILPVPQYYQGIAKDNCRLSIFDKVNPEFAHVGEQPVHSDEFFVDYDSASSYDKDAVWGYVPRYADYMTATDEIHGNFRDNLKFWHTALEVDQGQTQPNLELTDQILKQDWYKDAYKIFAFTGTYEYEANPFRCVTYFQFYNSTDLPVNPAAII